MHNESLLFTIFLIFVGASLVATIALWARQALIVGYIILGVVLGPSVLGWVHDANTIKNVADVGIMFLLFLLGLNMPPQKLLELLRETTWITAITSLSFTVAGYGLMLVFGFKTLDAIVIGAGLMFSSTIIGFKLLPTTVLHHQRTGELMISILLLQDVIAIILLVLLQAKGGNQSLVQEIFQLIGAFIGVSVFAYLMEQWILIKLISRYNRIFEYVFLLAIGWCMGIAELAYILGLSHAIGAFIAGVMIATNRIALFIGESLKPLRDFFLIIFFFAMGASLDTGKLIGVFWPALVLALALLLLKPWVYRWCFSRAGEGEVRSREIGVRLGQNSEFAFLIAMLAVQLKVISEQASYVIQLATLISFVLSTYWIVLRYPTPIAIDPKLRVS